MSGRFRNIIILMVLIMMVLTTVYLATTRVIDGAFSNIEQRDVAQNTSRAVDALGGRVDQLQFKVTDWSNWDDTYAFVDSYSKAYIKSNLQPASLMNLGINYMIFYNEHQQLIYAKGVDLSNGGEMGVPGDLLDHFAPGSKLLATSETSVSEGLINIKGATIIMVSKPILTSDAQGPLHGTLIFAQVLSPEVVSQLAAVTHLELGFYRPDDTTRPADVSAVAGSVKTKSATVQSLSESRIAGYQTISDVYGKPALTAKVEFPRTIHLEATRALGQYLLIILLVTLASLIITVVLSLIIRNRDRTIQLKDEFFSMASHELRTPLTVIRDYAQLLSIKFGKQLNNPQFDEMIAGIGESSTHLVGVVNDFLDAARLERGQIPYRIEPFDIRDIITPVAEEFDPIAAKKGVTVDADAPVELPMVLGDRDRVRQVITNLVNNALKFTESGAITIRPLVEKDYLTIYVSDTGRGMSKQQQQILFKKFRQVHTEDSLRGSGLGLFISKMLVEQMGGRIKLETSAEGVGTTISFRLGIIKQRPAPTPVQEPKPSDIVLPEPTQP